MDMLLIDTSEAQKRRSARARPRTRPGSSGPKGAGCTSLRHPRLRRHGQGLGRCAFDWARAGRGDGAL